MSSYWPNFMYLANIHLRLHYMHYPSKKCTGNWEHEGAKMRYGRGRPKKKKDNADGLGKQYHTESTSYCAMSWQHPLCTCVCRVNFPFTWKYIANGKFCSRPLRLGFFSRFRPCTLYILLETKVSSEMYYHAWLTYTDTCTVAEWKGTRQCKGSSAAQEMMSEK